MAKELEISGHPYESMYETVKQAIRDCGFAIKSENKTTGKIKASSGFSLRSWGEIIDVEILSISSNKYIVKVSSSPKAQIFDLEKSAENEIAIINRLKKFFGL